MIFMESKEGRCWGGVFIFHYERKDSISYFAIVKLRASEKHTFILGVLSSLGATLQLVGMQVLLAKLGCMEASVHKTLTMRQT